MLNSLLVSLLFSAPCLPQAAASPPPEPNLTIEVTRWADGQPLAGRMIFIHPGVRWSGREESIHVELDEQGRGQVNAPEGVPLYVEIAESKQTRHLAHQIHFPIQPGERRTVAIQALPATLSVSGRVLDGNGKPMPNVVVRAVAEQFDSPMAECESNAAGEFHFPELAIPGECHKGEAWVLSAHTEGFRSQRRYRLVLTALPAQVDELSFDMRPTVQFSGQVLDKEGRPAGDAQVAFKANDLSWMPLRNLGHGVLEISQTPSEAPVYTSADGNFLFADYLPGRWTLEAMLEFSSDARQVRLEVTDRQAQFSFVPTPAVAVEAAEPVQLSGVVLDQAGSPLDGVQVEYRRWGIEPVLTDSSGRFQINSQHGKIPGADLHFHLEGYAAHRVKVRRMTESQDFGEIVLLPGLTISGKFARDDGAQLAGMAVRAVPLELLQSGARVDPWYSDVFSIGTGSDGEFEINGLWPGKWQLRVEDGVRIIALATVQAGERGFEFQQDDGMTAVKGRVLDSITQLPIFGATIVPVQNYGGHSEKLKRLIQVTNSSDGSFHLPNLVRGIWWFEVEAEGNVSESSLRVDFSEGAPELSLLLGREASRRVWVFDGMGERLHEVSVGVTGVNGRQFPGPDPAWPMPFGFIGKWDDAVLGLPMGDVVFHIQPTGTTHSVPFPVRIEGGSTQPIEFHLKGDFSTPRQEIEVTVLDTEGGSLREDFNLLATDEHGVVVARWQVQYYSDKFRVTPEHLMLGFYRPAPESTPESIVLFRLPPGRHTLSIEGDGWQQQGPEVTIVEGEAAGPITIVVADRADNGDNGESANRTDHDD